MRAIKSAKVVICFLTALFFGLPAFAESRDDIGGRVTVGVHIASVHSSAGFNNFNPGLYIKSKEGWTGGFYRNSVRKMSFYAGKHFEAESESGRLAIGLTLGFVTGYDDIARISRGKLTLLAVPSIRVSIADDVSLRAGIIPNIGGIVGSSVIHFALEKSF